MKKAQLTFMFAATFAIITGSVYAQPQIVEGLAERCVNNRNYIKLYETQVKEKQLVGRVGNGAVHYRKILAELEIAIASNKWAYFSGSLTVKDVSELIGLPWDPAWDRNISLAQIACRDRLKDLLAKAGETGDDKLDGTMGDYSLDNLLKAATITGKRDPEELDLEKRIAEHKTNLIALGCSERCTMAGKWKNEVEVLGSSTWTITADGKAQESGIGSVYGTASISGRTLTIKWRNAGHTSDSTSPYYGTYTVTLDAVCNSGDGTVTWDKHPAADKRGPVFGVKFARTN